MMAGGREIIETASRMSPGDLSVLLTALQQPAGEDVRLSTVEGSSNHALWSLLVEKGWLEDRGNPKPDLPIPMASFSIVPDGRKWIYSLAIVCYEGVRQGLTPEEIVGFAEGKSHPKLAHLE
jgi:hypothetical protein